MTMENEMNAFSKWLFNRYVLSRKVYASHHLEASEILLEALNLHLKHNLQHRNSRQEKRATAEMLTVIRKSKSDGSSIRLSYIGAEAENLSAIDAKAYNHWQYQVDNLEGKILSAIDLCTEKKALQTVAKVHQMFAEFKDLRMTTTDDAYLCGARKNLTNILERNGYTIDGQGKIIELKNIENENEGF